MLTFRKGNYFDDQKALIAVYNYFSNLFLTHSENIYPPHKPFKYGSFIGERITSENKPGKL